MFVRYAVMGNPIAHSLSPIIHQLFAEQTGRSLTYEKILIDLPHFEQQVQSFFSEGGKGLNITLPCKQRAFAMAEEITPRCLQAGAANTLWMQDEKLHADNTDGVGLLRDLGRAFDLARKAILILGAGGATRGILGPLLAANPSKLIIANRTLEKAQALQTDFPAIKICTLADLPVSLAGDSFDVIINATSASLDSQNLSLPETLMANKPLCYDLAYNKTGTTPFVTWAQAQGSIAKDGLGMLVEQAAEAFFIWHGVMPDTGPVLEVLQRTIRA